MSRGHKGLSERPEVAQASDDELLGRVSQARERVREAKLSYNRAVTDAMIRRITHAAIAEAAGVTRRALFDISSREWDRRRAEQSGD